MESLKYWFDLRILVLFSFVSPVGNWTQALIFTEAQQGLGEKENMGEARDLQTILPLLYITVWPWETWFISKRLVFFFVKYIFYDILVNYKSSPRKAHHSTENSGIYIFWHAIRPWLYIYFKSDRISNNTLDLYVCIYVHILIHTYIYVNHMGFSWVFVPDLF